MKPRQFFHDMKTVIRAAGVAVGLCLLLAGYTLAYGNRILPHVHAGTVDLGGMTIGQAREKLEAFIAASQDRGVAVRVDGDTEQIHFENLGFRLDSTVTAQEAFAVGRRGEWYARIGERLAAPFARPHAMPAIQIDRESVEHEIEALAELIDHPRKDIRLDIRGARVTVLTDTRPGKVIDREKASRAVTDALERLDFSEIPVALADDVPSVDLAHATAAKVQAERMMALSLTLTYDGKRFAVSREEIGSWILSGYRGDELIPTPNERLISQYVTTLAAQINVTARQPVLRFENGKVTEFIPPASGHALEENATVRMIVDALNARITGPVRAVALALPVKTTVASPDSAMSTVGITELVGAATTSLVGSPRNRISNIINGVKFLTGIIIRPGEEFSTVGALGTIDNTTGYLPELVIKGTVTAPEFGGGLCQVSTTLFRAVLNAGLPVTARSNHAYRVSYYEKDGNGAFIGPGLDATIYQPEPDFRFRNDTSNPVLIYGYVRGTQVTFELYGTRDGRTARIDGPHILSETPSGDPIMTETDTLPQGVTKQTETAHPGGSAIATYTIAYPDGRTQTQQFRSYYRRWPARFLVGTGAALASPTPSPKTAP